MHTKSKCKPSQMLKVIQRNMELSHEYITGEHKLVLSIIGLAIADLNDKKLRANAVGFFNGELFSLYCDLIGLNSVTTRELLVQGGFLSKGEINAL